MIFVDEFPGDDNDVLFKIQNERITDFMGKLIFDCKTRYLYSAEVFGIKNDCVDILSYHNNWNYELYEDVTCFIAAYYRLKHGDIQNELFSTEDEFYQNLRTAWIQYYINEIDALNSIPTFVSNMIFYQCLNHYNPTTERFPVIRDNAFNNVMKILAERYRGFPRSEYRFGKIVSMYYIPR